MANPNQGEPPHQLSLWADEVNRLSGGTLTIKFENDWRLGEARYEAGTLEDVKAGKADMAWVGARGVRYGRRNELPGAGRSSAHRHPTTSKPAVFEQGIPQQMLAGVADLDLVGIGVLPGPMRKLLGVSKPFLGPADFEGQWSDCRTRLSPT